MCDVKRLNYHHLLYFYTVSKEGSVTAAAETLGVAQPTVSTQLQQFEQALGHPLFHRIGRGLELTVTGRIVQRYANDIFSIGDEMLDTLEGRPVSGRVRLRVGVADALPKMAVARVLGPLLVGEQAAHLTCYEGKPANLLAKLSVRELDLVLSDSPVGPDQSIRAFNHLLGECSVTVFASQETSVAFRREFPQSLEGARFVLPTTNTALRRMLDDWFAHREIHPLVIAEIEDSALVKAFAQVTGALFAAPSLISDQVATLYGAMPVGEIQEIQARFYAISLERKVKNPVVRALLQASREDIFS